MKKRMLIAGTVFAALLLALYGVIVATRARGEFRPARRS